MLAGSQFGDYSAVFRMQFELARNDTRKDTGTVFEDSGGSLIARTFNRKNSHQVPM